MDKFKSFEEFISTQSVQIPIVSFVLHLLIAGSLALVLGRVYIKYGRSLSNRNQFAQQFVLLAMTTMVIISIVKSSLALSLGLVGALSIVRFRAAIKEPEELTYLFLSIAIGLGAGADQLFITSVAVIIIVIYIVVRGSFVNDNNVVDNLYLTIIEQEKSINVDEIINILDKYCVGIDVKRYDVEHDASEVTLKLLLDSSEHLQNIKQALLIFSPTIKFSFIDSEI